METINAHPLKQVYFYLTAGCNLRCSHCWIGPKYQSQDQAHPCLDFDLFVHIIEEARPLGLTCVKLTGGEPLLHPDIGRMLAYIRSADLRLVVETNGVLCTRGLAREIARSKDAFVSVSLDGADGATHEKIRGVEGCFEAALAGIRNLVAAGIEPQVIMTLTRHNRDQLADVVRLAESLGADSVKFNILQPVLRGKKMHDSGEALPIETYVELGNMVETELAGSTPLRLFYSHPAAFRPLSRLFGENGAGCWSCGIFNIIGVLSDGSYALCGIGQSVRELLFGRAERDSLADVWQGSGLLRKLREGLPDRLEGICERCLMKRRCLGSCVAQNYYGTNRLWSPFWYCAEAERKGLFPRSRLKPGE